ncbi:MAG: esterase/lipase family protein [Halobacteriales archaeon]
MSNARPTVLVHGFADTWYTPWWSLLRRYLSSVGIDRVETVDVGNVPGTTVDSPRTYAGTIGETIERLHDDTGELVNVVAHSMGGLGTRWYVEKQGGNQHVDRLVTLSTPHQGTRASRLAGFTRGARDMTPTSDFILELNSGGPADGVDYTALWSKLDPATYPSRRAALPDTYLGDNARNVLAGAYSHIEMVARKNVFNKYKTYLVS